MLSHLHGQVIKIHTDCILLCQSIPLELYYCVCASFPPTHTVLAMHCLYMLVGCPIGGCMCPRPSNNNNYVSCFTILVACII